MYSRDAKRPMFSSRTPYLAAVSARLLGLVCVRGGYGLR